MSEPYREAGARASEKDAIAYDRAKKSWGFPRFAKGFPRNAELDALVVAFTKGDYATVRDRAPKLAASAEDEDVKRAAEMLRARLDPDPGALVLFALAGALLLFLTVWWVMHDGPPRGAAPAKPPPTMERID
jgi:hypothetical protein